jgi:hypothetical protein
MNIGVYGILFVFGAFVLLFIFNPNLSCFGRKIKSPFYPLLRRRRMRERKVVPAEDYGFDLGGGEKGSSPRTTAAGTAGPVKNRRPVPPAEDYGFRLGDDRPSERGEAGSSKSRES